MDEFNMYADFITDNSFATVPFLKIPETDSDAYVEWTVGSRLDKIAFIYYNNAALGKFILLANPEYISEADFNVGDIIRIPLPKENMFNFVRSRIAQSELF
jgi:hypothetical protein